MTTIPDEVWKRADEIFARALEVSPGERASFLHEECANDRELAVLVGKLLDAVETATGRFHTGGAVVAAPSAFREAREVGAGTIGEGTQIGPYRLLTRIGQGGMGEVWLAEQETPRRRVALKIVKPGMDSRQVIARFESEREALARMDHPNIARVFDAGRTSEGRPFFVMEHVKGESITAYCDRHRLSTRERLELFADVCRGVQHAHQKAVIHRDLKPSNILVTVHDDRPVPKIIDFGVAKALDRGLTEHTLYTEIGQVIGTPAYMSPEQAEMSGLDIDTRTDVYSLGVVLYELLTGVLPFDPRALRGAEMQRRLREQEPERPSTRISSLGEGSRAVAEKRRTQPGQLARGLEGDLDWITLKALEKDRTRRYPSAAALGADIERALRDEPVEAGPPSVVYRARKFVRRHRLAVAFAATVGLLLVVFAAGMGALAVRLAEERDRANQEARTAERSLDLLSGIFRESQPDRARGTQLTAREILDRGAERVEREMSDEPEARARLEQVLGTVYEGLGLYERADRLYEDALATYRATRGEEDVRTASAIADLGLLRFDQGRYEESELLLEQAVELQRRLLGPEDPATLRTLGNLASLAKVRGDLDRAETLYREVWQTSVRVHGEDAPVSLATRNNLANVISDLGRRQEALAEFEAVLADYRRVLGADHPDSLGVASNLAIEYAATGRLEEALVLDREVLEARRRVLGPDHPDTLMSINNLASHELQLGRYEQALDHLRQVLEGRQRVLGPEHDLTALAHRNVGLALSYVGDREEAIAETETAVELLERALGADHPQTVDTRAALAFMLARFGRDAEALESYEAVLPDLETVFGTTHDQTVRALYNLACLAARLGEIDDGLTHLETAVARGFTDPLLLEDPDLEPLRGTERYRALAERLREAGE